MTSSLTPQAADSLEVQVREAITAVQNASATGWCRVDDICVHLPGVPRREINRCLYDLRSTCTIESNTETPPLWRWPATLDSHFSLQETPHPRVHVVVNGSFGAQSLRMQ